MSPLTQHLRNYGTLLARVLVGGFFLMAGISKLQGIEGTAAAIAGVGLPASILLAWVVVLIEVLGGLAIILGKKASKAALVLAVFVLVVNFTMHGPALWAENQMQQVLFMKNIAIIAGLLYIAAYGPGEGWKLNK